MNTHSATTVGIIAHTEKEGAANAIRSVVKELEKKSIPFLLEKAAAALIQRSSLLDQMALTEQSDLLLVMGGDGSILRALHRCGENLRPIFGLNIGSLGFLTCLPAKEYQRAISCIADKNYVLSQRSLLEIKLWKKTSNETLSLGVALNDVVISRGERSQLVQLSVSINNNPLTEYHADGLIVATPTGSTAYSLAAGGPIIMPESRVLVITPICPHVFSSRSMVIDDTSEIAIHPARQQDVFLSIDGHTARLIKSDEILIIRTSPKTLPLAMLPETTFAEILRQKLSWRGSNFDS